MGYFIHHWRCCGAFISIHLGEAPLSLHMLWVPNCCHKINEIIELFENLGASFVQGVLLLRTILLSSSSITKRQIQWFRSNHLEIFSSNFLYHDMSASVPGRLSSISFGMDQCLFIVIMTGITICDWQVWLGLLMFWSIRLGNHKKIRERVPLGYERFS